MSSCFRNSHWSSSPSFHRRGFWISPNLTLDKLPISRLACQPLLTTTSDLTPSFFSGSQRRQAPRFSQGLRLEQISLEWELGAQAEMWAGSWSWRGARLSFQHVFAVGLEPEKLVSLMSTLWKCVSYLITASSEVDRAPCPLMCFPRGSSFAVPQ